jgi:hypothetical protein
MSGGIITQLRKAIARLGKSVEELKGETNPQLIELRQRQIGRLAAYKNVLDFLTGNRIWLNEDANGALPLMNALKAPPHSPARNEHSTSTSGRGGGEGGQ